MTELRKQVKPDAGGRGGAKDRDRDDFGRIPRDEDEKMDEDKVAEVEKEKNDGDDREKGVQIKGDDGDIEVEY